MGGDEDALMTLEMQDGLLLEDVQLEGPLVGHFRDALVEVVDGLVEDVHGDRPLPVAGRPSLGRGSVRGLEGEEREEREEEEE